MIYIYTEDKKEGLTLINNAVKQYLSNYNITTGTIDGIKNLTKHINDLQLNKDDIVYYIYDDVTENIFVQQHIQIAKRAIMCSRYKKQIILYPIFCCEHSLLIATDIERFSNINVLSVILEIQEYKDLQNITRYTKSNTTFDIYYNRARKERERTLKRLQRKNGKPYTQNDIEVGVSAEKLFKEIFKDAFTADLAIGEQLGKCWEEDCCIKKQRICSMYANNRVIYGGEKRQYLVDKTIYIKIIQKIACDQNLELKGMNDLSMDDIKLNKKALQIVTDYKHKTEKHISECETFIKQYVYTSGNYGSSEHDIINYCIFNGYTEYQAKKALENVIRQADEINKAY